MHGAHDVLLTPHTRGHSVFHLLTAAPRSAAFIAARPRLWWLVIAPFLLNSVIIGMATYLGIRHGAAAVGDAIARSYDGTLGQAVGWIVGLGLSAVAIMIAVLGGYFLASALSSPFNDLMTERIEEELLATRPDLRSPPMTLARSIVYAIKELLQRLFVVVPLFGSVYVIAIIPCIGPVVAPIAFFVLGATFLSLDAFSYPLDRRRVHFRVKLRWLRERAPSVVPFGVGLALLAPICFSPLYLPPLAAVAATRLYCEWVLRDSDAPANPQGPVGT